MSADRTQDDALFEQAFDLIIRLKGDTDKDVAADLVRAWKQRSPRHEEIWAEAFAIHMAANTVVRKRYSPHDNAGSMSRRALLRGGAASVIIGAAAIGLGPQIMLRMRADAMTATAQLQSLELPDGSVVTLGPDSAVRHVSSVHERRVELLAGMAYFNVVPDRSLPFRVVAELTEVAVSGAAFELSMDAGMTSLAVQQGEVAARHEGIPSPRTLYEGDWVAFDANTGVHETGKRDTAQVGAWRDNMVIAENENVAAVVARIARWKTGSVVIADRDLGAERISGVYNVADPVKALEAVVEPHGGRVRSMASLVTVISRV